MICILVLIVEFGQVGINCEELYVIVVDFVVVVNWLFVDWVEGFDGEEIWCILFGGLVVVFEFMMCSVYGVWVGWLGQVDVEFELFDVDGIYFIFVLFSVEEVVDYYEGFVNDMIWLLYYDVIVFLQYYCEWWEVYVIVNQWFVEVVVVVVVENGMVWVYDYQLQFVLQMVCDLCFDVMIGYFYYILFFVYGFYVQFFWCDQVFCGFLGVDVIGFQCVQDVMYFFMVVCC